MADWTERYRFEGELACIDMRVRRADQLFDHRDPAPFHERDLDDDAADYLTAGVEELPPRQRFKIVVWINEPLPADLSVAAVTTSIEQHFVAARDNVRRRRKKALQRSRVMLAIAFTALLVLLTLAELLRDSTLPALIHESVTILAWVVMWRPLESLLFDWLPYRTEGQMLERIRRAPLEVRVGE